VLADADLQGEVRWRTAGGWRRSGHRPDLAVRIPAGLVVVEVELARKSEPRLDAILSLYAGWLSEARITGVVYVCGTAAGSERVRAAAAEAGVASERLRVELLDDVIAQAVGART
jgi:hypothetical protein